MKKAKLGARILMGLIFTVFGLNGFLHFIPQPPPTEAGAKFLTALFETGYFFPVLKGTEVICGILLLTGWFVPLSLVILSPIVVQIFLYHTILDASGAPMAIALVVLQAFLGYSYKDRFAEILKK